MIGNISKQQALEVLKQDAADICELLGNQSALFCRNDCPAFEEVADTRLYGFSCEVKFLIKCKLLTSAEGQKLINELEGSLDNIQEKTIRDVKMR